MNFYTIYKLYNDNHPNDFYIGSTYNLEKRIIEHNKKFRDLNNNNKLYSFIRNNNECISTWKFKIIENIYCDNLTRKQKEQFYINKYVPNLNSYKAHRTTDDYIKYLKEKQEKYYLKNKEKILEKRNKKINCECGGSYTVTNKSTHFKQKKHIEWEINCKSI